MTPLSTGKKTLITSAVILVVVVVVGWNYRDYVFNPWTRNGQVEAQVVQITPRVTGPLVELPIVDNQLVKKGDLLFRIDPRTFQSKLEGMEGLLAETEDEIEALAAQVEATAATIEQYNAAIKRAIQKVKGKTARLQEVQLQLTRYRELVKTGAGSVERVERAEADVADSEAVVDAAEAELLAAEAAKLRAEADLARDKANLGAERALNARRQTARRESIQPSWTSSSLRSGHRSTATSPT